MDVPFVSPELQPPEQPADVTAWQDIEMREQSWPVPALYVIATPIGNLRDMTLRALDCLKRLDTLAAEDTRVARRLLSAYGIECSTLALHQHNESQVSQQVIERLRQGQRVGYVSDAGTPAVSDPGARLVAAVLDAGFRVIPIPGASALTSAISAAGLPDAPLHFIGFLPPKSGAARRALEAAPKSAANLVLYEAPHRIEATLALLLDLFGADRQVTVARELTKQFERIVSARLDGIGSLLAEQPLKGEFVVLLHAKPEAGSAEATGHEAMLGVLMEVLPMSEAVAVAVKLTGAPRNTLYSSALLIKKTRAIKD